MSKYIHDKRTENTIPITAVLINKYKQWLTNQDDTTKNTAKLYSFGTKVGGSLCLLNDSGKLKQVICIVSDAYNFHDFATLPHDLPIGQYHIDATDDTLVAAGITGWGMGAYIFDRYKKPAKELATLVVANLHSKYLRAYETVNATTLVRDLINTPAEDMGPTELAVATAAIAKQHGAEFNEVVGEELLQQNFPAVHLIGRASFKQPRVITLDWGKASDPLICLVGKGVCFDTGGNNVKPASSMRDMKKDMGGAAHVLGLAQMIMRLKLPVQLKVIISAVENAIASNAHRQGDIVKTRKGLTVEIGHTDAEGRMILSDALTYACEFKPKLIIDFATLTGAARAALGAELPAVFSNEICFNTEIMACANEVFDPLWSMPLYQPYKRQIVPKIADLRNTGSVPSMAGCITAALFLQEFVDKDINWVHIDTFGWSHGRRGHAQGGDALGMSAMYNWISKQFGGSNKQ
ncbi:Peptidase B [hydrothermal vent metagenome]|uniref:Peptidase B n=1 Tax=hydrothermal vent metagenome TaxID=652676 RepID=A0A3B0VSQ8_9ZZZZ